MPIDTSSYYPEVDGPDRDDNEKSLNGTHSSLFGSSSPSVSEEEVIEQTVSPNLNAPDAKKNEEEKNIITAISHFLSWALVPLLMPVYGSLFIFSLSGLDVVSPGLQTAFTFIIAGITFVAPVLLILLLKFLGVVNDVGLNGQKERAIPYIITALSLGAASWFMASRGAPIWVSMFFAGGALTGLINLAINFNREGSNT